MNGEGIIQCTNGGCYNIVHLATNDSKADSNVTKVTRWLASGFNGFGQLCMSKRKFPQFDEIETPFRDTANDFSIIIAGTWSYLALASGCNLHLQGFVFNASNNLRMISTKVPIKSVAVCDSFCLVLQEDGKLFKVLVHTNTVMEEVIFQTNITRPKKRPKLNTDNKIKIEFVACGNKIMVAVGNSNEVFSGTCQIFQFRKEVRVKQLLCGFEHALLLTSNGEVYSWGNGLRGQLGQEFLGLEEKPRIIEALAGLKICVIATSGWHCSAISEFGDLYTWGNNSDGQLGLRIYKDEMFQMKEPTLFPLPTIIESPKCCFKTTNQRDCMPISVVCGVRHTILLLDCGSIFVCGYNKYGQLGKLTSSKNCVKLQHVFKHENGSVRIIGGDWFTIIGTSDQENL